MKIGERAERAVDGVTEFAGRRAAGLGRENIPEERMVQMAAAVIANRAADVVRHGREVADEHLQCFCLQFGVAVDGLVEIVHVGFVMAVVMKFTAPAEKPQDLLFLLRSIWFRESD